VNDSDMYKGLLCYIINNRSKKLHYKDQFPQLDNEKVRNLR
jgi:hypothetical protein